MTWIRVDDDFADHPKVMALEGDRLRGLGLWHVAASYCARYLTDGYVPANHLRAHAPASLVERMVKVGLFDRSGGGYILHDWLDYNPSKQTVQQTRGKKQAAGQAGGQASAQARGQAKSNPVPVPQPVPVPEVLSDVLGSTPFEEPTDVYIEVTHRRSVSQRERDWLEDLHARFSRRELILAMRKVPTGSDFLKRVDAYLEGAA